MSEAKDEHRPERKFPRWGHIAMFPLGLVMSAGLATSSEWNPLQVVSGLAFIATIPAMTALWIVLKINRSKTPDSLERRYMTAAYAAMPYMGGTALAIAVMRTVDNKWAGLGIAIGMLALSIAVLWNLGTATFAMLRSSRVRQTEQIKPAQGD